MVDKMSKQEEIREGIKEILADDLITVRCTHENPPPHKDCSEECGVTLEDQIAASNPLCSPVRSGGKKHKKCMDCWNEYIDELVARIQEKESSQGVVIKRETTDFIKCPCDDCEHKLIDEWGYFCDLACRQRSHWISQCAGANEARKAGYEPLVGV